MSDAGKRRFCQVLDVAMHNSGTTGREVAAALGVSEAYVSNVRSGNRAPFTIEALRTLEAKGVFREHVVAHLIAAREQAFVLPACDESDRELYGLGLNLMLDWKHLHPGNHRYLFALSRVARKALPMGLAYPKFTRAA